MEEEMVYSKLPVTWKALQQKDSNEIYFAGKEKKKSKRKVRSQPSEAMLGECKEVLQHNTWNHNEVKKFFPQLKVQQKLEDDCCEEIKIMNLQDLKVYTKRVIKKTPPEEELWNAADFPSAEINGAGVHCGGNKIMAEYATPTKESFSVPFKKLEKRKGSNGWATHRSDKDSMSSSCQTDHLFFAESYRDPNVIYLCTNLPPDLKKIFIDCLFERDELRRLLLHLLKLLCDSSGNLPQISAVPLKAALSSSEKAFILAQIF